MRLGLHLVGYFARSALAGLAAVGAVGLAAPPAGAAQPTDAPQAAVFAGGNLNFNSFSTVAGGPVVANGNVFHGKGLLTADALYGGGTFSQGDVASQGVGGDVLFNGNIVGLGGPGGPGAPTGFVAGSVTSAAGGINFLSPGGVDVAGDVTAAGDVSQRFNLNAIGGSVLSGGNVLINGRVGGGVTYGGTFTRGTFATIGGPIAQGGPVNPAPFRPLAAPAGSGIASTGPDVTLGFGERRTLAPGNYGVLAYDEVNTVLLTAGTYVFKDIASTFVGNALSLDTSGGPIKIFVDGDVTLELAQVVNGTSVRSPFANPADSQDISFEVAGNFTAGAPMYGSIFAPNGSVTLQDFSNVTGRITAAGDVNIGAANVTVVPEPAGLTVLLGGAMLLCRRRSAYTKGLPVRLAPLRRFLILLLPLLATRAAPAAESLKDAAGDRFLMGAAVTGEQLKHEKTAALIVAQFDHLTPEFEMFPQFVHPEPGTFTFDRADAVVDFALAHKMGVTGHMLVWGNFTPAWMFAGPDGKPLPREEGLKNLRAHIEGVMRHYKGKIGEWHVVNEALSDAPDEYLRDTAARKCIGDDYVIQAFKIARETAPDAKLLYNDYNIEDPVKLKKTLRLLAELKAAGAAVDGVGIQGHWLIDYPPADTIDAALTALAGAGYPVSITELDVDVLPRPKDGADLNSIQETGENPYPDALPPAMQQKLADRYAAIFRVLAKHATGIDRVTFWGVTDAGSWLNGFPVKGRTNYPLLFDRQSKPKPAFGAVVKALRE